MKRGFIATSLIYSFFLVFLMLMAGILARSANNRILLDAVKQDIREELDGEKGFVIDVLEPSAVGDIISFANESWKVIATNSDSNSMVLVLNRSITKNEIESAIAEPIEIMSEGILSFNTPFYKDAAHCNDTICQIRACREAYNFDQVYCNYYTSNNKLHSKPLWMPTEEMIKNPDENNIHYRRTIVSMVVNTWFDMHQGLRRVKEKDKLLLMDFSDGYMNITGYIRIPTSSEASTVGGTTPFHLIDSDGPTNTKNVKIYNGTSVSSVPSSSIATIKPVIEAKIG